MTKEKEWNKLTYEIFSRLEKDWLDNLWLPSALSPSPCTTRILSIDGGGMKGLVAAQALVHLESRIQAHSSNPDARIADYFDVVAGTGIGGIFAALILADDGRGRPLYSAAEAVRLVADNSRRMFKRGLLRRGFSGRSLDAFLAEAFRRPDGDRCPLTLRDTLKPLLVPCYDLRTGAPFVFSRADAAESLSFDFELHRVCRATSATPYLFRPVELASVDGRTECTAVDGGLVMNNPASAAVTHVLHNRRDFPAVRGVEDLVVLSLGNGPLEKGGAGRRERRRWSAENCSAPVVEVVLDGVSDAVDQILTNAFSSCPQNYVRIQASYLPKELDAGMDGWSARSVKAFLNAGEKMLQEKSMESLPFGGKKLAAQPNCDRLDAFAQKVVAAGKRPPTGARNSDAKQSPLRQH
ncbi:putative inactive patatin-like protein 9 [Nymphaea thermarum]|nr:putative inactive patatin-like protein 9 [Nymphaea thermarum]